MKIEELKKFKKILILGYGIEGKSTHEFLKRIHPKAQILIGDQKDDPNYLDLQKKADLAIRTPNLQKEKIYIPYTTATNIFFANINRPVIGITGTKGKSTTASLINHMLNISKKKSFLYGNIGIPMIRALMKERPLDAIYVVELSSYQLDDIKYSPHIGIITNIYFEHIDFHGSFKNYYNAKIKIAKFSSKRDYFIYNPRFNSLKKIPTKAKKISYMRLPAKTKMGSLLGPHNKENVRAVYTVSKILGISYDIFQKSLLTFKMLENRMQFVGTYNGITFINDAASSNPVSTIKAIRTFKNIKTIFLGGLDRGYNFGPLVDEVYKNKIENIVLFPNSDIRLLKEFKKFKGYYSLRIMQTTSMEKAVLFAYKNTPKGSICLLSTGAPSYTMFSGFSEKGKEFSRFVKFYGKKTFKN